jgi:hypothetical protein
MAAIMSVLVTAVMIFTLVIGGIFLLLGGIELFARLTSGTSPFASRAEPSITTSQLASAYVGAVVVIAAIVYICRQLRQILATLASGDPFVPENAPRLSKIAIAIGLTEIARILIALIVGTTVDGARLNLSIDIIPWAAIAALFILAQVFREGTRLRNEEKFTI